MLDQALSHEFPGHPRFGQEIKPGRDLRQVLDVCREAARTPDGRVFVEDKGVRDRVRNIANPLELGTMSETHFVLGSDWKNQFDRQLTASGQASPTAADLRRWMDLPRERGLPREIQNLLILVYADHTNRSFYRHGANVSPTLDDIAGDVELRAQALPDLGDWQEARSRAADLFGHAVPKPLNAATLTDLASKVGRSVAELRPDGGGLAGRLIEVMGKLGVAREEAERSDRVRTARAATALLDACDGEQPIRLVGGLAAARIETGATAMARSLKSARDIQQALERTRWDLFTAVSAIRGDRGEDAAQLLRDLADWLKADEHALAGAGGLPARLSEAEARAIRLLTPPRIPASSDPQRRDTPPPGWTTVESDHRERLTGASWTATADELARKLAEKPTRRLTVRWTIEEER